MIQELHISNLAVIEDTTLDFNSDYVSLIGETGAGKSLIVDSLGLLKGEKADFSLVRDPKKKAVIVGAFHLEKDFIDKHQEISEYIDEEGNLILKRTLNPDRSSKTYLNDEPVSLLAYKKVISHLIDIQSQGSSWELFDEKKHLFYLDGYGGNRLQSKKEEFSKTYHLYQMEKEYLAKLIEENSKLDPEYLSFQIFEIEKAHLKPHEIEDLNDEYLSLREAERIQKNYNRYKEAAILNEGSMKDILSTLASRMNPFLSSSLQEQAKDVEEKARLLSSSLEEFEQSYRKLDMDPRRIDEINQRLFDLKGLMRKYGKSSDEILNALKKYKEMLSLSDDFQNRKTMLEEKIQTLQSQAIEKAKELRKERLKIKAELEKAISDEMKDLGLLKGGFGVVLEECPLNKDGIDSACFEVRLNEGLPFLPLKKAASGGETSRLMLSLKVVLNALDPYDLLVFDEVDTGVSGRSASLIANKIKRVSLSSQILVISHLAQVVASSKSSILIKKTVKDNMTKTQAEVLDQDAFVRQVALMLSGEKMTDAALSQAKALIEESRG